jgi:electron transport complex protein RnfC
MMGYALASDANPLVKAANCLLVLSQKDLTGSQTELPCIRCGECSRVCPSTLLPQQLQWDVRNGLIDDAADHGLQACIECGCCDFVCPSHIPLTQWFRFGKSEFRRMRDEREKSQHARERHEAREQRLEVIKQSRVLRMEEKKKGLQDDEAKKAKIAAAMSRVQKRTDSEDSRPENNPSKEDST